MNQKLQKRLLATGAIMVAIGLFSYLAVGGIGKNLVYFWDVKELLTKGQDAIGVTVRLGGVVKNGSLNWDAKTISLKFIIATSPEAEDGYEVPVHATAAPPQMFKDGIGAIVEGSYDGKVFQADRVIVKHSNEYHPPKDENKPMPNFVKELIEQENSADISDKAVK